MILLTSSFTLSLEKTQFYSTLLFLACLSASLHLPFSELRWQCCLFLKASAFFFPFLKMSWNPIRSPEFLHKISPSISIFNLLHKQTIYTNAQYWHENNLYFSESISSYKYNTAMYALYLQIHWHLFQKACPTEQNHNPLKDFLVWAQKHYAYARILSPSERKLSSWRHRLVLFSPVSPRA